MNKIYSLNEQYSEKLLNILKSFSDVKEVILYGSRAKGTNTERSDIDLVIKNSSIDRHYLGKIKMEIDESDIPYNVDLQIFEKIKNPDLINHIQRVGRLVYAQK